MAKFLKISNLAKIIRNCNFGANFWKILILVKILGKSRGWSKLSENFDFDQNFGKMLILVKILNS